MIRVLIAEDHLMVRAGIRALLEKTGEVHVLGEASNGQEAVDLARSLKPDVLIMDIMMPRLNGIQAARALREMTLPLKILLLSMYSDEAFVHQALQNGVKGYVLKSSASDELIHAVRAVADGQMYLSPPISEIVIESAIHPAAVREGDALSILSPREVEVLQLIAEGHTSGEIGRLLFISEKTVEKHRTRLMDKLKVKNLAGLVRMAVKFHLVDRDE